MAISSRGAAGLLTSRSEEIAALLERGAIVVLPDVRGTGVFRPDSDTGPSGGLTAHAATSLMLGEALLAQQLRDVRWIWSQCAALHRVDHDRKFVWGESLTNPAAETTFAFPRRVERPAEADPSGPLLAILLGLVQDDAAGVCARGGLVRFSAVLDSPFVQVPLASIVPGALGEADLPDFCAALAPRRLTLAGLVDGRNRAVSRATAEETYGVAVRAYTQAGTPGVVQIVDRHDKSWISQWLAAKSNATPK